MQLKLLAGAGATLTALLAAALPATADDPGRGAEPVAQPTSSMIVNAAVDDLRGWESDAKFGTFVLDSDAKHITVYWKGLPPTGLLAAAMLRNDGVTVDIASAPFTKQEIATQVQAVADLKVASRLPIVAVGPTPDLSALEVEIDSTRLTGSVTMDSIREAVTPLVDAPVTYLSVVGGPLDRTRSNDSPPWQGGAGIFADQGYCSTGFSMLVSGGYGRILSAAHCDPTGNAVIEDGAHEPFSPGGADVDVAQGYDSLLIDPNNGTIGEVYGGPWNATEASHPNRYDLHVGGDANASVGEDVCVGGANTGEHCNAEVIRADFSFECNRGLYMCPGFRVGTTNGNLIGGAGDSGGPVYIERTDGRVGARGIYVNGVPGYFVDCTIGRFPPGTDGCDRRINVVGIDELEDRWVAQVEYD